LLDLGVRFRVGYKQLIKNNFIMWIKKRICYILLILFSLTLIVFWNLEKQKGLYSKNMPSDFNFHVNIASDSYIINTYNNTLTKTIDWEKDTTITLIVSSEFKESIYKLLREIDIAKYPPNYAPTSTVNILPSFSYKIKYTMDSMTTSTKWEENTDSENRDAKRLRNVFNEIEKYIEENEEVNSLPDSQRVFM
jgi:hypothetical protein